MTNPLFLGVGRALEMNFIYAVFFESGDQVFVKVGRSVRPYKRIQAVIQGSPFSASRAVFCHVGDERTARSVEAFTASELKAHRTRGEWYQFDIADGATFRTRFLRAFGRATGKAPKWSNVDLAAMRVEALNAHRQFQRGVAKSP